MAQPTFSRHIRELERQTKLSLFGRSPQGLTLTDQGERLVDAAKHMGESADRFTRLANGLSAELDGDLRNIANEFVGYYLLPPMLAAFRVRHPGVIRDGDHQPGQQSEHAGGGSGPVHVIRIWFGKVPYREVLS